MPFFYLYRFQCAVDYRSTGQLSCSFSFFCFILLHLKDCDNYKKNFLVTIENTYLRNVV